MRVISISYQFKNERIKVSYSSLNVTTQKLFIGIIQKSEQKKHENSGFW